MRPCLLLIHPNSQDVVLQHCNQQEGGSLESTPTYDVQAAFRKGRGTRDHCQHLLGHAKSKRVPEKHLFLLY